MTRDCINAKGEGAIFKDPKEAEKAYRSGNADLHAIVKVRISQSVANEHGVVEDTTTVIETTVGRAILSLILPTGMPFESINQPLGKKQISSLLNE